MPRLSNFFAAREREFFDLFEEAGRNIERAGKLIERIFAEWPDGREIARDLVVCEHEGDRITHDIIRRLNETFVTPIDREDIYALASALDDVVERRGERVDVLAVDRRHERLVEALDDVVRDPVALVLAVHEVAHQAAAIRPLLKDALDEIAGARDVGARLFEEVEELAFLRRQQPAELAHGRRV